MRVALIGICVLFLVQAMHAQIIVDAGKDTLQLCQGQTAQLGGSPTALGGRAPYRYEWEPPFGLSDPSSPNPVLTALRSNQRYILTVTDADGLVGRDTVLLLMFLPPRINAGGSIEVCVGQDVVLGSSPTAYGGEPPYSFEWSGLPPSTRNAVSSNPTFPTDRVEMRTVILRVTDARGCTAYDTARISVSQPITLAIAQRSYEICPGEPVQVGANPLASGGSPPYRVSWTPQTGISSADIPNPTVFPTTTTRYYCTITDTKGCTRTDSILIRVKPAMTLRVRDTSICYGKEIQLGDSAMVSGGVPPYQYQWEAYDERGNPVQDTFDRRAVVQRLIPPASRLYRILVQDAQGCVQRAAIRVTVTEPPPASFALPPEICQGKTITFGTAYNRFYDYQWQITGGGIILGDPHSNVIRIRWDSSGLSTVSLRVHDREKGCDYHADATVRIHSLPQPRITAEGRVHLCPGETTTLNAGSGYTDYVWSNGARTQRITISDQQAGVYTVTVTDSNGCTNTSPPETVRANTTPQPTITGPSKFCAGTTIELRATPGFARYEWNTGATTPTLAINEPGTYRVTVYDSIGCPGSSPPFTTVINPVSMSGGGDAQFLDRETLLDYPEQTIFFVNTDDEPLTLGTIRITPNYPELRIVRLLIGGRQVASTNGQVLQVGERLDVVLKYSPLVPDTTVVRVELDVLLPCPWTYVQPVLLSSYDKRITTIAKALDTHGAVGQSLTIPILLQLVSEQDSLIDATVDYIVRINGRMFEFTGVSGGSALHSNIDPDGWYSIHIVRTGITLRTTKPFTLSTIQGRGLATTVLHDSIRIARISVRDVLKPPVVQIVNGLLSLEPYCFAREIVLGGALQIRLQPNPASEHVTLTIDNSIEGTYGLELRAYSGELIDRRTLMLRTQPREYIELQLDRAPSGILMLTIETPIGTYRTPIVVLK